MKKSSLANAKRYGILCLVTLIIASCPLINLLLTISREKENEALEDFAVSKASEILTSVINDIPFAVLKSGNPAKLKINDTINKPKYARYNSLWAKNSVEKIFGNQTANEKDSDYLCAGKITNASGTEYLVQLKVEDVLLSSKADAIGEIYIGREFPNMPPNEFPKNQKLTFAFLKNPSLFSDGTWFQSYAPKNGDKNKVFLETELKNNISESPINLYETEDYLNPVAVRLYPNLEENGNECLLKKLILQIQWRNNSGQTKNFHLITVKGELD